MTFKRKRPHKALLPPGADVAPAPSGKLRARQLRAQASEAERKLWHFLRGKQIGGMRFRRQYPIGPYYADFVCLPARLVVEVDGSQHGEEAQAAHDRRRTLWLNRNNFRVVRFWAGDVMADPRAVLDGIERAMAPRPLTAAFPALRP